MCTGSTRAGAVVGAGLAALLAGAGCGEPEPPELRVRRALERAEAAAEQKNLGALADLLSERYRDRHGGDKREAKRALAFHLLRHESVHLLVRVAEIELPAPGHARAAALVAMAARPIPDPEALAALRADLYRFELELVEEDGRWRVVAADWRPARAGDFLP